MNAEFFGDYSWNKAEWQLPSPEGEKALRDFVRKRFGEKLASQPYAALVNVSLPRESRLLKAPLAAKAGGWGQIAEKGFSDAQDPAYKELERLVEASFIPLANHDIAGTCGLDPCQCGGCWVRTAREERQKRIAVAKLEGE